MQTLKSTEINDFSDMACSENPGLPFFEVCEAPQARCSGAQSSEHPGHVFSEVCEAPQARCSGAQSFEGEFEGANPPQETSGVYGGAKPPYQLGLPVAWATKHSDKELIG